MYITLYKFSVSIYNIIIIIIIIHSFGHSILGGGDTFWKIQFWKHFY